MIKKMVKILYNQIKKIIAFLHVINILKSYSNHKNIVLIGSPLHGNIGDHAISISEIKLLQKKGLNIVEIPGEYYNYYKKYFINKNKKQDIIVITGGGFLGTLWKNEEYMVRDIINNYSNNKVIIMPQTVYFSNDEDGLMELEKFKRLYNCHNNLHVFLRDKKSYEFCKKNLNKNIDIQYVPDVVLSLNYQEPKLKREDILLCLREDKEKVISDKLRNDIIKYIDNMGYKIKYTSTVVSKRISIRNRVRVFESKLNEFKSSKLVITDRLHGMIFSAITRTPCIAFDNLSKKVSGVYEWINYLNYICVLNPKDFNINEIKDKLKISMINYENELLIVYFNKILDLI